MKLIREKNEDTITHTITTCNNTICIVCHISENKIYNIEKCDKFAYCHFTHIGDVDKINDTLRKAQEIIKKLSMKKINQLRTPEFSTLKFRVMSSTIKKEETIKSLTDTNFKLGNNSPRLGLYEYDYNI